MNTVKILRYNLTNVLADLSLRFVVRTWNNVGFMKQRLISV